MADGTDLHRGFGGKGREAVKKLSPNLPVWDRSEAHANLEIAWDIIWEISLMTRFMNFPKPKGSEYSISKAFNTRCRSMFRSTQSHVAPRIVAVSPTWC